MGKKVKKVATYAVVGTLTGGAGIAALAAYDAYNGLVKKPMEAQKDAIRSQQRQQQALIDEQRNAEATAKAEATAMRRAEMAGQTQTKYATALGSSDDETTAVKKKKTVLGG